VVNLATGTATDYAGSADTLISIEGALGFYGADSPTGSSGDDLFDPGAGNDIVDADIVVEAAIAGTDLVQASISYTRALNVENLTLTGTATINGTGNDLANVLIGNTLAHLLNGMTGADGLNGGNGDDTLIGGQGADTLTGGAGSDIFRYLASTERGDVVADYRAIDDTIEVSASGFGGGLVAGMNLAATGRYLSNLTGDANAARGQFTFETDARTLWWGADGTGAGARVAIATFTGLTSLAALELVVIA